MKTIEQRAMEYSLKGFFTGNEKAIEEAYIAGAKDQQYIDQEIMLKKEYTMTAKQHYRERTFYDWYILNGKGTPKFSDAIEWERKQTIDEVCDWFKTNVKWMSNQLMSILIYELRKAMEEQKLGMVAECSLDISCTYVIDGLHNGRVGLCDVI